MKTETANSRNTTENLLKAKPRLAIEYRAIATLSLDPKNPRLHAKKQISQIAKSIDVFGFLVPVLVDDRGQLIAGHGRVLAAQHLGMIDVPTVTVGHLTEAQLRAFTIADNRLTENSTWDERLLAEQLKSISALELDFTVDVTGFDVGEIDLMLEGLAPNSRGKEGSPVAVAESGAKPQVTRTGDLWDLGSHRVCCGDACIEATFAALMRGRRASAVFSDLRHNDPLDGYVAGFGENHHSEAGMAFGAVSGPEYATFLIVALTLPAIHSVDGALQFVCMNWRHTPELLAAAQHAHSEFEHLCIWVKDASDQGSLYRDQHELVFVFKSGKGAYRENIRPGQIGRHRTDVWKYRGVKSIARSTGESHSSDPHHKIKPIELVADAILDSTARGEIVLDPFLGSGTTVIAAERTGRICYGIERNPRHVDASIRRWQRYTGFEAVHQRTGQTFAQREKEACHARQG